MNQYEWCLCVSKWLPKQMRSCNHFSMIILISANTGADLGGGGRTIATPSNNSLI